MIFAHRRGRDAGARKACKIPCFGTPNTTTGRTTSIETTQKHVVFTTRDNEKRRVFWREGFKWREGEKSAKFDETLTNSGGLKEREPIFIAPQRPYFPS